MNHRCFLVALIVGLCVLLLPLACGTHHQRDLYRGPTDYAAAHRLVQKQATMARAARVAPNKYYGGTHYYRIATDACYHDPAGLACRVNASRARKRLEAAFEAVARRDVLKQNKETAQMIDALAKLDLTPPVQQQQQQTLQTPHISLKHRALWRAARHEFGVTPVSSDLNSVTITLRGLFKPGSDEFIEDKILPIAKIAEMALNNSDHELLIQGYTDSRGSTAINLRISRRRAAKVKALMVQNKVEEHRISVVGHGEALPVADNATEAGRAANRRIEIVFLK